MPRRLGLAALAVVLAAALVAGCSGDDRARRDLATRGYILLSLDTLRADHLGTYGYPLDTSPFLDALAARGVVFERCYAQLPGTLPSHMTMLTGLYPAEHGVMPPSGVLDATIPLLPERLQAAGFRTGGHAEGGYVHAEFGFARGFDEWSHESRKIETDVERTLARGLDFLAGVPRGERFFLFLHSYVVHDPYFPPAEHLARFWKGPVPEAPRPTGPVLSAANRGEVELSPAAVDFYRASYDASIHYADSVLRQFFAELEARGLLAETTVVITSDHGEEFREHGMMGHEQTYPEALHVPLIVLHPRIEGPRRVPAITGLVDLAPTFYDLTGVEPPADLSGRSLVPYLVGEDAEPAQRPAFAQDFSGSTATVIEADDGGLRQLLAESGELTHGRGTSWLVGEADEIVVLDGGRELAFTAFHEPRQVEIARGGETIATFAVAPGEWTEVELGDLPAGFPVLQVRADGCAVPSEVTGANDRRCLSVAFRGLAAQRLEVFDLATDPLAAHDLRRRDPDETRRLLRLLLRHRRALAPRAGTHQTTLDPELEERLRALGYLD